MVNVLKFHTKTFLTKWDHEQSGKLHIYPKFWNRLAIANIVDPDQMPQNAASDQGLHCLPYMQRVVKWAISYFRAGMKSR